VVSVAVGTENGIGLEPQRGKAGHTVVHIGVKHNGLSLGLDGKAAVTVPDHVHFQITSNLSTIFRIFVV
jgi:hypothetical protein